MASNTALPLVNTRRHGFAEKERPDHDFRWPVRQLIQMARRFIDHCAENVKLSGEDLRLYKR